MKSRAVRDLPLGHQAGSVKKKSAQRKVALDRLHGLLARNVRKREAPDLPRGHQVGSARKRVAQDLLLGPLAGSAMSNFMTSVKL